MYFNSPRIPAGSYALIKFVIFDFSRWRTGNSGKRHWKCGSSISLNILLAILWSSASSIFSLLGLECIKWPLFMISSSKNFLSTFMSSSLPTAGGGCLKSKVETSYLTNDETLFSAGIGDAVISFSPSSIFKPAETKLSELPSIWPIEWLFR